MSEKQLRDKKEVKKSERKRASEYSWLGGVVEKKPACVYSLVDVQRGLLREAFHAQIALEGPFAGVHSHVDVEVRFATECRRTLQALERPSLYCMRTKFIVVVDVVVVVVVVVVVDAIRTRTDANGSRTFSGFGFRIVWTVQFDKRIAPTVTQTFGTVERFPN